MTWIRNWALPWWISVAIVSVAFGSGLAVNQQLMLLALAALLGAIAVSAPASQWAAAALVAALLFRGLVQLGVLPSVATLVDMPIAWGALAVAMLKRRPDRLSTVHIRWLAALAIVMWVSWAFHPSEVLRPLLYLALLGEPFAIVAALCLDPPSPQWRKRLERLLLLLLLIQIPVVAFQLVTLGPADHIQGTLYGAGAGAHVISAVALVGGFWIIARRRGAMVGRSWWLAAAAALLAIPFVADAKQVILASPAILLASRWQDGAVRIFLRTALVVASVAALVTLQPGGDTAVQFLERTEQGRGGKGEAASFVWDRLKDDPASIVFGLGPAETVSRAAFMTTDLLQRSNSPIRVLNLEPANVAMEAQSASIASSGGGTSFNSGVSSALGLFGDLGVAGLGIYVAMLTWLFLLLRRRQSPEAAAAAAGFAMFGLLGFVFDWWEQPPFSVTLAVLAGLALSATHDAKRSAVGEA